MSRKQSAVERIRKKKAAAAAAPTPIERDPSIDPFHNGQTPACRLLHDAVQDIFPELQNQMKQRTVSSELGQLLRWQVLKRRKDRLFPPAPPLSSDSPRERRELSEEANESAATAAGKKKRKKKKKKKEASDVSTEMDLTISRSEESEKGKNTSIGNQTQKSHLISKPVISTTSMDEQAQRKPLAENKSLDTSFDPSIQSMDRSVHDFEETRMILKKIVTPNLQALPSDDLHASGDNHSSRVFLEQIQQESTEREEDDDSVDFKMPLAPAESVGTPQGHHSRPRTRSRTLSSSSFASFDEVVTPTTKNTADNTHDENGDMQGYMVSPVTHEWVPEEGSEAKTETPPGDVIKNPLELPYLRTLSRVDGLTTTTIDGSLISAEWTENHSADSRTSTIETTKILMDDWMAQLLDHSIDWEATFPTQRMEKEFNSFISFLQGKLRFGSQPCGIPISDLRNAVIEIDCGTCQQDALIIVDDWASREASKPLMLNPVVLQDRFVQDANDVDTAFDYVALEEGHHLLKPDPPDEEDGENVDSNVHLTFHIDEPPANKNGAKHIYIDQMTSKHVITLVECWLPCGIEEEILVATSVSASHGRNQNSWESIGPEVLCRDEALRLQSLVLEKEKLAKEALDEIGKLVKEIRQDLDEIRSTLDPSRPNIEIVAYPKMKQVDEKCTELSDKILETIQLLTGGQSDGLESLKLQMWTAYLETMGQTLKACETYYTQVCYEMADQSGALPVPFVSAAFRNVFKCLIEEKVGIWTSLGTFMCDHWTGRRLKQLYTRKVWYSERTPERKEKSLCLDDECCKLVKELASWTITLRRGRISEIQRERMSQTERMLENLQSIVEPLANEYASVEKYFSTERNLYFASLRSNIVLAHGVKRRMRLVDASEVEGMTTGVILMWTHVRLMQNRMINAASIPSLPLQLKRWMLHDEDSLMNSWHGGNDASPLNSYHQRYCQPGRQGKRRVMCVLAGLVYCWLREQCTLWKADMAEKELLTNLDVAGAVDLNAYPKDIQGASKINKTKKTKKKKNKNASISNDDSSSRLEDSTSCSANYSSSHLNGTVTPPLEVNDGEIPIDNESVRGYEFLPQIPQDVDHGENGGSIAEKDIAEIQDSKEMKDELIFSDDKCHEISQNDSELARVPFRIFIQDGNTMIAPEDFLVSRIREKILESTKNNDIVVIG